MKPVKGWGSNGVFAYEYAGNMNEWPRVTHWLIVQLDDQSKRVREQIVAAADKERVMREWMGLDRLPN